MTLQQLRYVIGVAQYGSFNAAAEKLYISQPSLSASIRELENEIGFPVFVRTSRGIVVSTGGEDFLGYARQVIEQADLLESRYKPDKTVKRLFSVSTQHYAFAVNAFVEMIRELDMAEYDCTLRETRTHEIIEDVRTLRSEVGILYRSGFNKNMIDRVLRSNELNFIPLFTARPHVFISARHPLAGKSPVLLKDLDDYPCLSFDQGEFNSFHYAEEILSSLPHRKRIRVGDRATLFNLLIGLNGYTISTGILTEDLNGNQIISVPLEIDEHIEVGYITRQERTRSLPGKIYLDKLSGFTKTLEKP